MGDDRLAKRFEGDEAGIDFWQRRSFRFLSQDESGRELELRQLLAIRAQTLAGRFKNS